MSLKSELKNNKNLFDCNTHNNINHKNKCNNNIIIRNNFRDNNISIRIMIKKYLIKNVLMRAKILLKILKEELKTIWFIIIFQTIEKLKKKKEIKKTILPIFFIVNKKNNICSNENITSIIL